VHADVPGRTDRSVECGSYLADPEPNRRRACPSNAGFSAGNGCSDLIQIVDVSRSSMYQAVASILRTHIASPARGGELRRKEVAMAEGVTGQAPLTVPAAPGCATLPLDRSVACRWTR
jgi:hypothetical protein